MAENNNVVQDLNEILRVRREKLENLYNEGKNPFILDSKEPTGSVQDFLNGENRYLQLKKANPELADKLFTKAEQDLLGRYEVYKKMAGRE